MKKLCPILCFFLVATVTAHAQTKAFINRKTKSFSLVANIREDHQIFGYATPNVHSEKLILFSVFTNDVKNNPYHCPLGAYYETSDLKSGDDIRFVSESPTFIKLTYLNAAHQPTPFYVKREFVRFD
ncbi:MAG: hypothetical protein ACRYG7_38990 [Janthinobacterium lividum]